MNPLAKELNTIIENLSPEVFAMLSDVGKAFYYPKGILIQSVEAKQRADKINATIGIATEKDSVLSLLSITKYIKDISPDDYLTYASSFGLLKLREKWKTCLFEKNPSLANKKISLPIVTSGITHAISIFADMWITKDDVVILPDMMWGNYSLIFNVRHKARLVHYKAFDDQLTCFNLDAFGKTIKQQAKDNDKIIVILNFPHNPSGYSPLISEADKIAQILIDTAKNGTRVIACFDDSYFGLVYEKGVCEESLFAKLANSDKNLLAVKFDGATKEEYVWGFRIGFITYAAYTKDPKFYEALEKKTAGYIRSNISNASNLSQILVYKSLNDENHSKYKKEKKELLKKRALKIKEILKNPLFKNAFDVYPFNSGYFMCIRLIDINANKLRLHLLNNYGIGLISIGKENIRIAFSCFEDEQAQKLFSLILKGINELRQS